MKTPAFRLPAVRTLAFAALLGAGAATSDATTYTWLGTAGNAWNINANWQGGVAPPSDLATRTSSSPTAAVRSRASSPPTASAR